MTPFKTIYTLILSLNFISLSSIASTEVKLSTQYTWKSSTAKPSVSVVIIEGAILAEYTKHDKKIKQQLQIVNDLLLHDFAEKYIEVKDFTGNGLNDIAVMKGAGYGGSNTCYMVYPYQTDKSEFNTQEPLTACK